jgi:hypothetical protein
MTNDDGDPTKAYEVGYGRPPKHAQFRKGRSGNPKGRPKGAKNVMTILHEALSEKASVRQGDKARKLSKVEIMIRQLVNKAATGDLKAVQTIMNLMRLTGDFDKPPEPGTTGVLLVERPAANSEEWERRFGTEMADQQFRIAESWRRFDSKPANKKSEAA